MWVYITEINFYLPLFPFFFLIGIVNGLFYATWRENIFGWHPDPDTKERPNLRKELRERRKFVDKKAPFSWEFNNWLHTFLGVLVGWLLLWFLLDKRLNIGQGFRGANFGIPEILLLVLAYIGIKGRLPTIADSVQDWLKR